MMEGYTTPRLPGRAHVDHPGSASWSTGVTYRHPGLLAQDRSRTLDVLSEGRGELGIGGGLVRPASHAGLGVPFPPVSERFRTARGDAADLLPRCGATNEGPFKGKHYELAETICQPPPISRPAPAP